MVRSVYQSSVKSMPDSSVRAAERGLSALCSQIYSESADSMHITEPLTIVKRHRGVISPLVLNTLLNSTASRYHKLDCIDAVSHS